jgi:hexosaminidase
MRGTLLLRKRNVALFTSIAVCVTCIAILFTYFGPLRLLGYRVVFANPAPQVIPSLREWYGGSGSFTLTSTSRIVIDPADQTQLMDTARVFQSDLFNMVGRSLPIVITGSPGAGDFSLTLSSSDDRIGNEGYLFNVGDGVTISARTSTGIFYGTRTALQILQGDPTRSSIPRGRARDYPKYQERGFMLDVGRKFFSIGFLEDEVRLMAWYKMNDFHLHFNDNAIGAGSNPDWMHQYAAFRLNSARFPGLASADGSYSQQDIRSLEQVARQYAVTITPEIDAPAHALAFAQYRPDLTSQKYPRDMLDLNNPGTFTFLNAIWNEFLPWFDTTQVDIGTDECVPQEANGCLQFMNTYDAFMKQHGKSVRMWASLTKLKGNTRVNTDIVLDMWDNRWANPLAMVKQGFHIINANDNLLYIVPGAGYFHDYLDTRLLYEQWEPYIFDFSNPAMNLEPGDPHVLGGMFAEWNDKLATVVSDADVQVRVNPAMQTLGEKLWSGTTTTRTYEQFFQAARQIGAAPGTQLPR